MIAGGGIAGLAAALGLAQGGREVQVFEQHQAFTELGAGVQMSPNAVRALRWLGAWDAVEPLCVTPAEIRVRNGRSGALLQRIALGASFERRFGAPYRVVHRGDLLAGLVSACTARPEIHLALNRQAVSARDSRLVLSDGERIKTDLIVACDGIRSALRQERFPGTMPVYRGHALYRALLPVGDVPRSVATDAVTLWLYPRGHVVHYPVSAGRAFNIVAAIDSAWHGAQWSEPGEPADLARIFAAPAAELADVLAAPKSWLRWAGADLPSLALWTQPGFALAGDAAHATLPYLAQGAAMALEDACVLAQALRAHGNEAGLAAYDAARRPRCSRIQAQSRKLAGLYHATGAKAGLRNAALQLMPASSFLARNAWIYAWQPPA